MRTSSRLQAPQVLIIVGLAFTGCSGSTDPLTSFQAIAERCKAGLAIPRPAKTYQAAGATKWNKAVNSPYAMSYDVKRTDSLVSPHVANIEIKYEAVAIEAESEAAAQSATLEGDAKPVFAAKHRFSLTYAHQSGNWKLQSIKSGLHVASVADMPEVILDVLPDQFRRDYPEATSCIEAKAA